MICARVELCWASSSECSDSNTTRRSLKFSTRLAAQYMYFTIVEYTNRFLFSQPAIQYLYNGKFYTSNRKLSYMYSKPISSHLPVLHRAFQGHPPNSSFKVPLAALMSEYYMYSVRFYFCLRKAKNFVCAGRGREIFYLISKLAKWKYNV